LQLQERAGQLQAACLQIATVKDDPYWDGRINKIMVSRAPFEDGH